MKMKYFAGLMGLILALTSPAFSQKKAPKFTSVYTSLGSACKVLKGHNGTDDAELCRGVGGYQIRIYSSATMTHMTAELRGTDTIFPMATVALDFDDRGLKVEWRLANGKPFAAIVRIPKYADRTDGEPGVGKKIGEQLIVVGLKGFEELNTAIDAKTRGANSLAREAADSAYLAK